MEAHIIKSRFEANDIPCFLADEHTIGVNPLYSQALGGIKLMVFFKDIERCQQVILSDDSIASEPSNVVISDNVYCPYCKSDDVQFGNATQKRFGIITLMVSLFFLIYPFHSRKAWHCYNCSAEF